MTQKQWWAGTLVGALSLMLVVGPARADVIQTYDFTGSLVTAAAGNSSVAGQFALDLTNATVTQFTFSTPLGVIDPAGGFAASLNQFTPAVIPTADLVQLVFRRGSTFSETLNLIFEADLATFSGNTFLTTLTFPVAGVGTSSGLSCLGFTPPNDCNGIHFFGSSFVNGGTVLVPTSAVPEPSTLLLLSVSVLGFAFTMRRSNALLAH